MKIPNIFLGFFEVTSFFLAIFVSCIFFPSYSFVKTFCFDFA